MKDLILILLVLIETFYFGYFLFNFKKWDLSNNWKYFLFGIVITNLTQKTIGYCLGFFGAFFN